MKQLRPRHTLRRTTGLSLHRQLFLSLRDQLLQGMYPPRSMIPSEETLCEQFGVSRITVRRAVADLEASGLLEKRHGRGTFVSADLPPARPHATLGLLDSLRRTATQTRAQVLSVERASPPPNIAEQLDMAPQESAVHALRLRWYGSTPVLVTEVWVTEPAARLVTAETLQKRPLFEILIARGTQFGRVVQEITAIASTPFYADLLQVEVGAPLVKLTRLLYDTDRVPVLHLVAYASPERSRILMDVSIGEVDTLASGSIVHDVGGPDPGHRSRKGGNGTGAIG